MTDKYECPVEGCDYTGVMNSVAAHYSGTQSDDHKGGYERAKVMMEQGGPVGEYKTPDTPPEGDTPDAPEETDRGTSTVPDAPAFPAAENGPEADGWGGCPKCGGSMSAIPAGTRIRLNDGRTATAEAGDEWCDDCGVLATTEGEWHE